MSAFKSNSIQNQANSAMGTFIKTRTKLQSIIVKAKAAITANQAKIDKLTGKISDCDTDTGILENSIRNMEHTVGQINSIVGEPTE